MALETTTPEKHSSKHTTYSNEEETQEKPTSNTNYCCFWIPCFGGSQSHKSSTTLWERIESTAEEKQDTTTPTWWARGVKALKKVRECSELVAGPKWKTFIRRFNNNHNKNRARVGKLKFQYDPLSYSLNFDEGSGQNGHLEDDDGVYREFSSRYASIPISAKSAMDLGKDGLSFT